jgi:hypothetical protein
MFSASSITTPSMDVAKCTTTSYNIQFRYETEQELELQLQREYGNVNWKIFFLHIWFIFLETTYPHYRNIIGTTLCSASSEICFRCGGEVHRKEWQCCQLWLWNWYHIFPTLKVLWKGKININNRPYSVLITRAAFVMKIFTCGLYFAFSIRLLVLSTVVGSRTLHSRSKRGGVWSTLVRMVSNVRPSCLRELNQRKSSSNRYKSLNIAFSKLDLLEDESEFDFFFTVNLDS